MSEYLCTWAFSLVTLKTTQMNNRKILFSSENWILWYMKSNEQSSRPRLLLLDSCSFMELKFICCLCFVCKDLGLAKQKLVLIGSPSSEASITLLDILFLWFINTAFLFFLLILQTWPYHFCQLMLVASKERQGEGLKIAKKWGGTLPNLGAVYLNRTLPLIILSLLCRETKESDLLLLISYCFRE